MYRLSVEKPDFVAAAGGTSEDPALPGVQVGSGINRQPQNAETAQVPRYLYL